MNQNTPAQNESQSRALAWVDEARQALSNRQQAQAEQLVAQALELAPDCIPAIELHGVLESLRGNLGAAAEAFRRVTVHQPEQAGGWFNLGKCQLDSGEFAAAIASQQKALALQPDLMDALVVQALARRGMGQISEAVDALREAIDGAPNHVSAISALGSLLAGQGAHDQALEMFERALAIQPGVAQTHYNLGEALLQAGRLTEASEALHRALTLDHHYHDARLALARVAEQRNDLVEATSLCQRALRRRPQDLRCVDMLMRLLLAQNRLSEMEASLDQAREHHAQSYWMVLWQAQLDERRGRTGQARTALLQLREQAIPEPLAAILDDALARLPEV